MQLPAISFGQGADLAVRPCRIVKGDLSNIWMIWSRDKNQ